MRLRHIFHGIVVLFCQHMAECFEHCGKPYYIPNILINARQRIIEGTTARQNSYPWMVSVHKVHKGKDRHICGASVLRVSDKDESDIVISTAHCFDDRIKEPILYKVIVGGHSQTRRSSQQVDEEVKEILVHPKYRRHNVDMALIKLKKPIKFNESIQPICLPRPGDHPKPKTDGIATGWGEMLQNPRYLPDKLQQVKLPVIDDYECAGYHPKKFNEHYMFCAGYRAGVHGTCGGDSGGPYMTKRRNRYYLTGITSWGNERCDEREAPAVYVRVSNFVDWIEDEAKRLTSVRN